MSDVVGYRVAIQEERAAALRSRVQQLLAPFDGSERALDSGCGAGALAFALAPFVESVVGIDLSADLVDAGRALAPANCELVGRRRDGVAVRVRLVRHRRLHARPPPRAPTRARRLRAGAGDAPGRPDPPRRPARLRRPGRLGRDGPVRAGTRSVSYAAAARPGHPEPARRQRSRRADERDRARAAGPRALPRSRRARRARSGDA